MFAPSNWGLQKHLNIIIAIPIIGYQKKLTGAKRREWMGMGEWDDY